MKPISLFTGHIREAEVLASNGAVPALAELRKLPLADFAAFMFTLPKEDYPQLSQVLPRMADEQTQRKWTGTAGAANVASTLGFIQISSYNYQRITGTPLNGKRILDYGCGYGRMIRLLYHFTDPDHIVGCDPWNQSVNICIEDGILGRLDVTDYLPARLPYETKSFHFAYANSVFTHTSERATLTALRALRPVMADAGILLITIRPVEFWSEHFQRQPERIAALVKAHHARGFAFSPHKREEIDGDVTYGDTSMTLEWLITNASGWRVAHVDRSLLSPLQILVFLAPI